MMGIPVEEPILIYADNQYAMCNTSDAGSALKKKSNANAITIHYIREGSTRYK